MFLLGKFLTRPLALMLASVVTLVIGLDTAYAAAATNSVTAKNLKQTIASATTASDYKAIAAYYRAEATKAHELASGFSTTGHESRTV